MEAEVLVIKFDFFRLWAQGSVKISNLKFRRDFEAEFGLVFCCWCFVEVMKFNLGRNSEARFGQDFGTEAQASFESEVYSVFWCWSLVELMKIILDRNSEAIFGQNIWSLSLVEMLMFV